MHCQHQSFTYKALCAKSQEMINLMDEKNSPSNFFSAFFPQTVDYLNKPGKLIKETSGIYADF